MEAFVPIKSISVSAYTIPTEEPESDGTLEWESTTLVLVEVQAADATGLGYTYSDVSCAHFIRSVLRDKITGRNALDVNNRWHLMRHAVRNLGQTGIAAMAISAVDNALWDLKAKLLQLPLVKLLGQLKPALPAYGSGGFTSYSIKKLQQQLGGWASEGMSMVKMKVGRNPGQDEQRVKAAREAIGKEARLFVDANEAYSQKQALQMAGMFTKYDVSWFEQPIVATDLEGYHFLRNALPAAMQLATGEYGWQPDDFLHILHSGAADVLQADVTRCSGISGLLRVAALCEAWHIPLSCHTAPAQHLHVACACEPVIHAEYFYEHYRIENLLFDGVAKPEDGMLKPDLDKPGIGIEFKKKDAEKFKIL